MIVTGGNSLLQGFSERLNRDLSAKTPQVLDQNNEKLTIAILINDCLFHLTEYEIEDY